MINLESSFELLDDLACLKFPSLRVSDFKTQFACKYRIDSIIIVINTYIAFLFEVTQSAAVAQSDCVFFYKVFCKIII